MIFQMQDSAGRQHDVDLHIIKQDDGRCMISQTYLTSGNGATLLLTPEMAEHIRRELGE